MSIFDWLRGEFAKFGLAPLPLRDFDLPDEPSATVTHLADRVRPADTSPALSATAAPNSAVGGGVDGPAAPVTPGAVGIHPSQWSADDHEAVGREYLAKLYAQVTRVADDCADLIELIEQIDPTPLGLANATRPPKRKGRSSRE